jgi:hypothetical protein
MIAKLVKKYTDHQEKKLHEIAMAATVIEANILKAEKCKDEEQRRKHIEYAINDIRYIKDELTSNDFKFEEYQEQQGAES